MELNELKSIWQQLDHRLAYENSMTFAMMRHQKMDSARTSLRQITVGQTLQLLWGVLFILLAGLLWSTRPDAFPVIVAGIIVHAYGIGCVIVAAFVLSAIHLIDYAGSVLDVQGRLARVRRAYVISSLVAGFTWWFFWVPLLMVLFGLLHVNLYAHAPSVVWGGLAIGVAGLSGMWLTFAYSRRSPDSRLRHVVDEAIFSKSLRRAQAQLDEILQFDRETV